MALAVLDDLGQDLAGNVGEWDAGIGAIVLDHMLDRLGFKSDGLLDLESFRIGAFQNNHLGCRHAD